MIFNEIPLLAFDSLNVKSQANVDSFEDEDSDEKKSKSGSDGAESPESSSIPCPPASKSITASTAEKEDIQPINMSQDMGISPPF